MALVKQGEDAVLDITLNNSVEVFNVGTVATQSSICTDITLKLYSSRAANAHYYGELKLNGSEPEGRVEAHPTDPNKIRIVMTRELTKAFCRGALVGTVEVDFIDSNFTGGRREAMTLDLCVITLPNA